MYDIRITTYHVWITARLMTVLTSPTTQVCSNTDLMAKSAVIIPIWNKTNSPVGKLDLPYLQHIVMITVAIFNDQRKIKS